MKFFCNFLLTNLFSCARIPEKHRRGVKFSDGLMFTETRAFTRLGFGCG